MNKQTILLLIFIGILGTTGFLWYRYAKTLPPSQAVKAEDSFEARLSDLRRLKDLQLDVSLFRDPFFKTLQSSEDTVGEKVKSQTKAGRENPFLPF